MKILSRRSFLANTSFFSIIGIAGFFPFLQTRKKEEKNMFVHHVFFWLKNSGSEEDGKKLLEGLKGLKKVEVIKSAHIGKPADTNRPVIERGYDFSWLLTFDSPEDQEIYQKHPIHLDFVDKYASLWEKVIVYDSVTV